MKESELRQVQELLGCEFSNHEILKEALTHSSQADHRLASNERLEFFGDAILSLVICQRLFDKFPKYLEGDLTKIKSALVSRKTCSLVCGKLGLTDFLKVGRGMSSSKALAGSLAAGMLEALIAAIYLDGGFEKAKDFILNNFGELIDQADAEQHQENFKSLLQQYSQQHLDVTPAYELLDEKGPDHNKCFEVGVVIGGRRFKSAWGTNKKEAEQNAAYNALIEMKVIDS